MMRKMGSGRLNSKSLPVATGGLESGAAKASGVKPGTGVQGMCTTTASFFALQSRAHIHFLCKLLVL
jgi:hypothetical protein